MGMTLPKLIMFDLDDTLALSKQPLDEPTAKLLAELLERTRVAVISGGALPQFLSQVVAELPKGAHLTNLYLLPTSGGALYEYDSEQWNKVYEERLSDTEARTIDAAIRDAAAETGVFDFSAPSYGERVEFRGSQVTVSALGQKAPLDEKKTWDPDRCKRLALQEALIRRLPDYTIRTGGLTSVDITKRGIDKAYGIRKICGRLGIKESDTLYVGDQLQSGGNDEAVYTTEAHTKEVTSIDETARVIEAFLR